MSEPNKSNPFPPDLKIQYWRLRAMAHLIGNQRNEDPPFEMEEIYFGIGDLLNDIASSIHTFIEALEAGPEKIEENETCQESKSS